MPTDPTLAECSECGRRAPRDDMFGIEPELLCERCRDGVAERLAPGPVGRPAGGSAKPAVVTIATLAVAAVLFVACKAWTLKPSQWPELLHYLLPFDRYHGGYVSTEPWRLLTSAFLHIGIIHIVFNAWWIWSLGRAIEERRGSLLMLFFLVGSAVGSSAIQWMFSGSGVGLSGVVYALAGFLFLQRKDDPAAAAVMNPSTTRLLAIWLVIGVVLSESGTLPIGNWAHGGGAVWGLAAGAAARMRHSWIGYLALAAATVGLVAAVTNGVNFWPAG